MVTQGQIPTHRIVMEERNSLIITGVQSIIGFDESFVRCITSKGELYITGNELSVEQISVHDGEMHVHGQVNTLEYRLARPKNSWRQKLLGET